MHVIEECCQDASAVVQITHQILKTLKAEHPEISNAALRQDNAGCYHSVSWLSACLLMGAATGIHVKKVDFSDPQGGKGPSHRTAATIKAHVRRYINEGHDVLTARDFKDAVLSYGGVKGVRVALLTDASQQPQQELSGCWRGIRFLNTFLYQKDCVTVWRAFDIGQGNNIPSISRYNDCVVKLIEISLTLLQNHTGQHTLLDTANPTRKKWRKLPAHNPP